MRTATPPLPTRATTPPPTVVRYDPARPGDGRTVTALDSRAEHRVLAAFSDRELGELPLLPEGVRLGRYRRYVDLRDPGRRSSPPKVTRR